MLVVTAIVSILLLNFPQSTSYNLYTEGYLNVDSSDSTTLPGSSSDARGMPNIPFTVDTNRYADGFTSTGAYDITSPHFPLYPPANGAVTSDRAAHFLNYMKSAEEQGIAGFGEGDARREDARIKLVSKYTPQEFKKIPYPSKSFPVYAAIKWNPSDFAIQEGEWYNVSVLGSQVGFSPQFWQDGGVRVNAEGYDSFYDAISNCYVGLGRCRAHLKKARRLPKNNWMSLGCSIGQFVRPLQAIEPGREEVATYLPLDEATLQPTLFNVGQHVSFRATYTGQLMCFANDAHTEYWNNKGFLNVTVTRISWPPSNGTYYTPLYEPACDSAQVVYKNYPEGVYVDNVKCNPNGGGSGWTKTDIESHSARYTSGAPDVLLH